MITYCRIEDKIIHGQTTTVLRKHYHFDGIIVINDEIASDLSLRKIYIATVPDIKIYFFTLTKGIGQLRKADASTLRYLVIFKDPVSVAAIIKKGYHFTVAVTCGQQMEQQDSLPIMQGLSLSQKQVDALRFIAGAGVDLRFDPDCTNDNISWKTFEKYVENAQTKAAKGSPGSKNTSLNKTFSILDCFLSEECKEMSPAQIQAATGIPVSTCYRLIEFLEQNGYLQKNKRNKKYSLGWKFMLLSSNAGTIHLPAFDDIVPLYIRNVRDKLNESTALFIQIGFKVKCICCEESHHTIQARFKNQQISDLTFDTTGCVFLSYLSPEQREAYMNLTEREVEELRCVLDTGYCIHYNSDLEGTSAVSVPVMLSQDNMIAVLTVKGPAFRFNETMGPSEIAELIKTAKEISDNYSNSIL